eukprot:TRINITY_DN16908_c0_g2_i1.p1 TRINITY_DN16908_c0_g2~~TRINITY_DN16908_c0_g2_i1.p1  ORF type:complete len:861 (+),score=84.92 TRINITY_DN16908_c0_g2_i1:171-2753(+)
MARSLPIHRLLGPALAIACLVPSVCGQYFRGRPMIVTPPRTVYNPILLAPASSQRVSPPAPSWSSPIPELPAARPAQRSATVGGAASSNQDESRRVEAELLEALRQMHSTPQGQVPLPSKAGWIRSPYSASNVLSLNTLRGELEAAKPVSDSFDMKSLVGKWSLKYSNDMPSETQTHSFFGLFVTLSISEAGNTEMKSHFLFPNGSTNLETVSGLLSQTSSSPQFTLTKRSGICEFIDVSYLSDELLIWHKDSDLARYMDRAMARASPVYGPSSYVPMPGILRKARYEVWRRMTKPYSSQFQRFEPIFESETVENETSGITIGGKDVGAVHPLSVTASETTVEIDPPNDAHALSSGVLMLGALALVLLMYITTTGRAYLRRVVAKRPGTEIQRERHHSVSFVCSSETPTFELARFFPTAAQQNPVGLPELTVLAKELVMAAGRADADFIDRLREFANAELRRTTPRHEAATSAFSQVAEGATDVLLESADARARWAISATTSLLLAYSVTIEPVNAAEQLSYAEFLDHVTKGRVEIVRFQQNMMTAQFYTTTGQRVEVNVIPNRVEDEALGDQLEEKKVDVYVEEKGRSPLDGLASIAGPTAWLIATLLLLLQTPLGLGGRSLRTLGRSPAKVVKGKQTLANLNDDIGCTDAKEESMSDEKSMLAAYHEAGHAILGALMSDHDVIAKINIIPRGPAGDVTIFMPWKERLNTGLYTKEFLENRICVALGGRIAEEMINGRNNVSTSASNDLQQCTQVAKAMVMQLGMCDSAGGVAPSVSQSMKQRIDSEVDRIVDEQYKRGMELLASNRSLLKNLSAKLIEQEKIGGEEFLVLINEAATKGEFVVPGQEMQTRQGEPSRGV